MDDRPAVHPARRVASLLAKLAVGIALFGLVAPAAAQSAPQPEVCKSAHAISV